jgi:hypothetical protein
MPHSPAPSEAIARVDVLTLAREVDSLSKCIQAESLRLDGSRAFVEGYAGRLLKTAARLYAATLPPAAAGVAVAVTPTQRPPVVPADALLATFNGERHAA